MGCPFSAVRRPIVTILGGFEGHAKQTWCTSLELNWPLPRRARGDNAKCPEIYIRAGTNVNFSIRSFVGKRFECFEASMVMLIFIQISTLVNIIHYDVTSAGRNQG